MSHIDIIATWPKSRPLQSYLDELARADRLGLSINYRVANLPKWEFGALYNRSARCYMVHDGAVRGYNNILYVTFRDDHEVSRVENDAFAGFWPAGNYVVRDPLWYSVHPVPHKGFQGWRYYTYPEIDARTNS